MLLAAWVFLFFTLAALHHCKHTVSGQDWDHFCATLGLAPLSAILSWGRTPMDDDLVARINQAVDECLDRCSQASTPPAITVDGYCRELLDDRQWPPTDVEEVRKIATRILIQRAMDGP